MDKEHYMAKIERNTEVISHVPEGELKNKYIADITWARNLVARLNNLDYDQRELAIKQIKDVMDRDYKICGFEPEEKETSSFSLR